MKVGMPRALLYYYYGPLWKRLFELLGIEVVLSEISNKQLVEKGIKVTVPEICIPIKIFNGHVRDLLEQDVDLIFVPRFVSVERYYGFCPKFMGLPELVRYSVVDAGSRLLTIDITEGHEDLPAYATYKPLCSIPGVTPKKLKVALAAAEQEWIRYIGLCRQGFSLDEAEALMSSETLELPVRNDDAHPVTLGVLGYVYNVYDPFASLEILNRLKGMGVRPVTFEMMGKPDLESARGIREKEIYWTFSDKLMGAGNAMINRADIDGVIHVTAFGCGPDSIVGKLLELESEAAGKPMMTLRIDEHTGESHLQTRLEAFVDMIARKKNKDRRTPA